MYAPSLFRKHASIKAKSLAKTGFSFSFPRYLMLMLLLSRLLTYASSLVHEQVSIKEIAETALFYLLKTNCVGALSHYRTYHVKEVIQPQVPLRLPCYDFTPVMNHTVVTVLPKVRLATSGATHSHGVTGGVYKARERIHRDILIRDY